MKNKTIFHVVGLVSIAFATAVNAQNQGQGKGPQSGQGLQGQGAGQSAFNQQLVVTGTPSAIEVETMLFMLQEEKLARDVYQVLAEIWDSNIFEHIAQSEQRHMDAITRLIDAYGLDSTLPAEAGQFTLPELNELYLQLVEDGSSSQAAAIEVGVGIETMDIADLTEAIANTSEPAQTRIYSNLLQASGQHLRTFNNAKATGSLTCDTSACAGNGTGNGRKAGRGMGMGRGQGFGKGNGAGNGNGNGPGKGFGNGVCAQTGQAGACQQGNCNAACDGTPARDGTGPNR